jgi:predicted Zn-ribbon and HTH transcriptional regulator
MSQENPSLFNQFRKRLIALVIVLTTEFTIGSLTEYLGQSDIYITLINYMYVNPALKLGTVITYILLLITINKIKQIENNPFWDKIFFFFTAKLILLTIGIIVHVVTWWVLPDSALVIGWIISEVLYSVAYICEALAWFNYGKYISSTPVPEQYKMYMIRYANSLAFACVFAIPYYIIDIIWVLINEILVIFLEIRFIFTLVGITFYIRGVTRLNIILKPRQSPLEFVNQNSFFNRGHPMGIPPSIATVARFCPKCGSALVPGEEFCAKCGWQRMDVTNNSSQKCPECGSILGMEGDFCTKCGWSKIQTSEIRSSLCPNCNKKLDRHGIHCPHCGWHDTGANNAIFYDCPRCGNKIAMSEDDCSKCGWKEE